MIITGLVFRTFNDTSSGYIAADREYQADVPGNVRFQFNQVAGSRQLVCGDRVECEIENSDKGYRAVWVRWIDHGWKEPEPVEFVEGSGRIKFVSSDRAFGYIKPDVAGAPDVQFHCSIMPDPYFRVRDRVSFIARQKPDGRWKATEIRITDKLTRVARNEQEQTCCQS